MKLYAVDGIRICKSTWKSKSRTFKADPVVHQLKSIDNIRAKSKKNAIKRARKQFGAKRGCRLKLWAYEV